MHKNKPYVNACIKDNCEAVAEGACQALYNYYINFFRSLAGYIIINYVLQDM